MLTSRKSVTIVVLACILVVLASITYVVEPPIGSLFTSKKTTLNVQPGETFATISDEIKKDRVVVSSFALRAYIKIFYSRTTLSAGEYLFTTPEPMPVIAWRLSHAGFGIPQAEVVIPEGSSVSYVASIIKEKYPDFNEYTFIAEAKSKEGFLFPDTYHFLDGITPAQVIAAMSANFMQQISPLMLSISSSGHTEKEIVTMASILEGEAQTDTDRKIVAGILWKRIAQGTRLQVDSTLRYETGKTSAELDKADLQSDSSYNTYTKYGLPPGPISNPGRESIEAALHPTATDYEYFLTDTNGTMHYSVTFAEHVANKKKYLE